MDLVVGGAPHAAIEFKYPREPNEKNAAWTMALGEVLKDLYRLSLLPVGERLFVYVETERLHRYMTGAAQRYGMSVHGDRLELKPEEASALPPSAASIIGQDLLARTVSATRLERLDAGQGLTLTVYLVDGPAAEAAADTARSQTSEAGPGASSTTPSAVSGARAAIHEAVSQLLRSPVGTSSPWRRSCRSVACWAAATPSRRSARW